MTKNYINVKKAAELLNVTPHYIRKLLREGRIAGNQTPETGRWQVERDSLDEFRTTDLYKHDLESLRIQMNITIKEAVENVEENFEADLISYIAFPGSPVSSINQQDCILLDDLLYAQKNPYRKGSNGKKYKRICLFLHSGGGLLEAAIKFIDIIRQYANEYVVVVPIMAKSAATAMVLMADKQYFTSLSELGPVDPLVQNPTKPDMYVPATAIDSFIKYYKGGEQKDTSTDKHKDPDMDPFILKKLEESFDPFLLGAHKTSLEFSKDVIKRALEKHAMKGKKEEDIGKAVEEFTAKYNSHSYPIMFSELREFGIGEKLEDEPRLSSVKMLLGIYQQYMAGSSIVKLIGNRDENKNISLTPINPPQQTPTRTAL